MKKIFITLLFSALFLFSFSQGEKENYKLVADSFELYYNTANYQAIFNSFAATMQQTLSLQQTKTFFEDLRLLGGKINTRKFVKYEKNYAIYKTNFERIIFAINISVDEYSKINGLYVKPYKEDNLPKLERNKSKLILPFKHEWTIAWGGDTKELNYHIDNEAQKNAFDIVIKNANGNTYKTNGEKNEDYYAFGQEIIAPCDGEVVCVVDGVKDNLPGSPNPVYLPGNTIVIKTLNDEYLVFAHFKQHTIVVKQGQEIKQSQILGLCGNSGNSSEPHLHFHVQNVEDMNIAIGAKCFFENIQVNGETKKNYSPIKNDKLSNK